MQRSISVVIPNYNGEHLLKKNLPSVIRALDFCGADYEIIVPDDNSSDNSLSFLASNYPQVKTIPSDKNLGFSGNINKGLRLAKMDLVLALNSDVSLKEDYFVDQLPYFTDKKVFGVMGSLNDIQTDEILVGAKICRQSFFGGINSTTNALTIPSKPLDTFYLSGANALMCNEKLNQTHYFNEIYSPFYHEDTDLGLVAWRMGWTCLFEPKSVAYHETSSTIKAYNKKKYIKYISTRNKFIFHYLHLGGLKRYLYFTKVLAGFLTRWIVLDFTFYKSFFAFIKMLALANEQRNFMLKLPRSTQEVINEVSKKQLAHNLKIF